MLLLFHSRVPEGKFWNNPLSFIERLIFSNFICCSVRFANPGPTYSFLWGSFVVLLDRKTTWKRFHIACERVSSCVCACCTRRFPFISVCRGFIVDKFTWSFIHTLVSVNNWKHPVWSFLPAAVTCACMRLTARPPDCFRYSVRWLGSLTPNMYACMCVHRFMLPCVAAIALM